MPVPDGLGGFGGDSGMGPLDRHTAETGLLNEAAAQLDRLAGLAIDEHLASTQRAFDPAVRSWHGVAAPELRAAGAEVAEEAVVSSGAVAWGAVPVRYWVAKVNAFNARVDELIAQRDGLAATNYNATGTDGQPPTADQIDDARAAAMGPINTSWWRAYNDEIVDGASTTASMYRDGPTAENLREARAAGAIPVTSGASAVFAALWHEQAMQAAATEAAELAEQIMSGEHPPSQRDLERLNELLAAHAGDPAFAYHLLTALGPQGLLELTGDVALTQPAGGFDRDLANLAGGIQTGLALALATATRHSGTTTEHDYIRGNYELPESWIDDLIAAGDDVMRVGYGHGGREVQGFQLLGVLISAETPDYPPQTHPVNFEPEFLASVGGAMLDFEMAHGSYPWYGPGDAAATNGVRLNWVNGYGDTAPSGFDPIGGLMRALNNNEEAALQFFSTPSTNEDGEEVSRVGYLLTERMWPYDTPDVTTDLGPQPGLLHLGSALEGATSNHEDPRARVIVHDMVSSVGQNGVVHEYLYRPLGDIGADWIDNLVGAMDGSDPRTGLDDRQAGDFLRELGRDEYAQETVAVAAGNVGAQRLDDLFARANWEESDDPAEEALRQDGRLAVLEQADSRVGTVAEVLYQLDMGRNDGQVEENNRNRERVTNITDAVRASIELHPAGAVVGVGADAIGVQGAIIDAYDDSEEIQLGHENAQAASMDVLEGLYWGALSANGGPASESDAAGRTDSYVYGDFANDVATRYTTGRQPGDA